MPSSQDWGFESILKERTVLVWHVRQQIVASQSQETPPKWFPKQDFTTGMLTPAMPRMPRLVRADTSRYISLVAAMAMVLYGYDASVFNSVQASTNWLEWFNLNPVCSLHSGHSGRMLTG